MSSPAFPVPRQVGTLGRYAGAAAALGVIALLIGGFLSPGQFLRSYLFGFLFWLGISLGCLALQMVHNLSGGGWGLGIKRILEAGSRNLRLAWLLFLPIALGLPQLYVWARPGQVAADDVLQLKAPFLNVPFFLGRAVVYFAIWGLLAHLLSKWSLERDEGRDTSAKLEGLSGAGLVLLALTITFASVDWAMSLNPHWYSTIYGMIFMVGALLSAQCLVILLVALLGDEEPLSEVISKESLHDLGKLLLAFVMLWAYMAVSQLIIVWSGNLPEEIPFYLQRTFGGWGVAAAALVLFHFALPFALLLSRDLKRNARSLATVAGFVLAMRVLDLFWLIGPDAQNAAGAAVGHGFSLSWLDVVAPLAIGGIWLAAFARELQSRPLLTPGDPGLQELRTAEQHA
jgi:hypothetical protein